MIYLQRYFSHHDNIATYTQRSIILNFYSIVHLRLSGNFRRMEIYRHSWKDRSFIINCARWYSAQVYLCSILHKSHSFRPASRLLQQKVIRSVSGLRNGRTFPCPRDQFHNKHCSFYQWLLHQNSFVITMTDGLPPATVT